MAQLTLYLDQETVGKMRQAAASEGLSQSQWVARLIRERLDSEWPQAVRELAGEGVMGKNATGGKEKIQDPASKRSRRAGTRWS